jgi:hypothetical protein
MFNRVFNFQQNRSLKNGMPNMASTLNGWEVPLTFIKITQTIVDGDVIKTESPIKFMGVWQPLRDEELQFKPENQRSWSWYWVHAKSGTLNLQTQDKFLFQDKRYKVMSIKDYSLNGFIEYQVIRDYEDNVI